MNTIDMSYSHNMVEAVPNTGLPIKERTLKSVERHGFFKHP